MLNLSKNYLFLQRSREGKGADEGLVSRRQKEVASVYNIIIKPLKFKQND